MKLSRRYALLVTALLVAIAASCAAGLIGLGRQNDVLEEVVHTDMRRVLVATNVRRLFRSMVLAERDLLLDRDATSIGRLVTNMERMRGELDAEIDQLGGLATAEERPAIDDLRGAYGRWVTIGDRVLAARDAGNDDDALTLARSHAADPVSWEELIAHLVGASERRLREHVADTSATHRTARLVIVSVSALAALVAVTLGWVLFLGIRRAMAEIVRLNGNLESQVAERTQALAVRERSMQLVLDSMGEGLVLVGRDGTVLSERSRAMASWFGEPAAGASISKYLYPEERQLDKRDIFACAFDQLVADILPFDLCAAQMPQRIILGDIHLELEYRQVFEAEGFTKVLVIARDVSARIASELSERDAREQHAILACLLRDRTGFEQFVRETEKLIAEIAAESSDGELLRRLHTLRGNAGIFGFRSVAERCHELEVVLGERGGLLDDLELADLNGLWQRRIASVADHFSASNRNAVEIPAGDYEALLAGLRARRDPEALFAQVQGWRWQRTLDRLVVLRAHAERLAGRMDKRVAIVVEDNDLRIPPGHLASFWSELIHVLRNAIDHGIETPERRRATGKDALGRLRLSTTLEDGDLVVRVADDGGGVNVAALQTVAAELGLPRSDLLDLVSASGVTTQETPTQLSGHGLGLGAVRAACERAGGAMAIESTPGLGTTVSFRLPRVPRLASSAAAAA